MAIDLVSQEGYNRTYTFDDADVTVPILSIGLMAEDENDVTFFAKSRNRGGKIHHLPTGEEIMFDKKYGVYWILFDVDEDILQPDTVNTNSNMDFHRHGDP